MDMAASDIKLRWTKEKDGWYGWLLPMFLIYKSGRQIYLDVLEPDRKPGNENRHIKIDSVHQGKCIAAGILKIALKGQLKPPRRLSGVR